MFWEKFIRKLSKKKQWKKVVISQVEDSNSNGKIEQQYKVLIVEDNAFNIVPIKATLEKNRIEFDIAKNGLMAVDRYNHIMKDG